jgi:hypothetical protein
MSLFAAHDGGNLNLLRLSCGLSVVIIGVAATRMVPVRRSGAFGCLTAP